MSLKRVSLLEREYKYICGNCLRRYAYSTSTASVGRATTSHLSQKPVSSPIEYTDPAIEPNNLEPLQATPSNLEKTIDGSSFALYNTTSAPNSAQLAHASSFFKHGRPQHLFTASKFRTIPVSSIPEVAFLGRSNVGKSSLLNALLHRTSTNIARTSKKPGKTREMIGFGVGSVRVAGSKRPKSKSRDEITPGLGQQVDWERIVNDGQGGGLVVLDMPGYGKGSREDWGREIMKYLVGRKQLRRTFLLIDSDHGLTNTDAMILSSLREHGLPHQLVLSKIDKLLLPTSKSPTVVTLLKRLEKFPPLAESILAKAMGGEDYNKTKGRRVLLLDDVIACSAEKSWPAGSGSKLGIDALRLAVLQAAGLESTASGSRKTVAVPKREPVDTEDEDEEEIVSWDKILTR